MPIAVLVRGGGERSTERGIPPAVFVFRMVAGHRTDKRAVPSTAPSLSLRPGRNDGSKRVRRCSGLAGMTRREFVKRRRCEDVSNLLPQNADYSEERL